MSALQLYLQQVKSQSQSQLMPRDKKKVEEEYGIQKGIEIRSAHVMLYQGANLKGNPAMQGMRSPLPSKAALFNALARSKSPLFSCTGNFFAKAHSKRLAHAYSRLLYLALPALAPPKNRGSSNKHLST